MCLSWFRYKVLTVWRYTTVAVLGWASWHDNNMIRSTNTVSLRAGLSVERTNGNWQTGACMKFYTLHLKGFRLSCSDMTLDISLKHNKQK